MIKTIKCSGCNAKNNFTWHSFHGDMGKSGGIQYYSFRIYCNNCENVSTLFENRTVPFLWDETQQKKHSIKCCSIGASKMAVHYFIRRIGHKPPSSHKPTIAEREDFKKKVADGIKIHGSEVEQNLVDQYGYTGWL